MKENAMKKLIIGSLFYLILPNIAYAGLITETGTVKYGEVDWYDFSTFETGKVSLSAVETNKNNHWWNSKYNKYNQFDSSLYLFKDDGYLSWDDLIKFDDNSGYGLESFMTVNLTAGDYSVAITSSYDNKYGYYKNWYSSNNGTGYTLNISGNYVSTDGTIAPINVAEPVSIILLAIGLFGIAYSRQRRSPLTLPAVSNLVCLSK